LAALRAAASASSSSSRESASAPAAFLTRAFASSKSGRCAAFAQLACGLLELSSERTQIRVR